MSMLNAPGLSAGRAEQTYRRTSTPDSAASFAAMASKCAGGLDAVWLNFGDSISAGSTDFPHQLGVRFAQMWPTHTVKYFEGTDSGWPAATNLSTGTTGATLEVRNAAVSAKDAQYWIDGFAAIDGITPDVVTITLGANESVVNGAGPYEELVELIESTWPGDDGNPNVPIILIVEPPHIGDDDMTRRMVWIDRIGSTHGYPVVDAVWKAFGGGVPVEDMYVDTTHPDPTIGVPVIRDALLKAFGLVTDSTLAATLTDVTAISNQVAALVAGLAGQLSPLTIGDWDAGWWAAQLADTLSDGDPISAWADGTGNGFDIAQATGGNQPVFRLVEATTMNSKAAAEFDGTDDRLEKTGGVSITGETSWVGICAVNSHGTAGRTLMGLSSSSNGRRIGTSSTTTDWYANLVSAIHGGSPQDLVPVLVRYHLNGAASEIYVNEVLVVAGTVTTATINQLVMGAGRTGAGPVYTAHWKGFISGVFERAGDVSGATWWPTFLAWVTAYYGITV